jgi:hypothetical protein
MNPGTRIRLRTNVNLWPAGTEGVVTKLRRGESLHGYDFAAVLELGPDKSTDHGSTLLLAKEVDVIEDGQP